MIHIPKTIPLSIEEGSNVLFLDDSPERTRRFKSNVPWATITTTAQECISALSESWDYVFLDHDLSDQVFQDESETNTGSEVVRYIVENKPNIKQIIIHSLNEVASENMQIALEKAGYDAVCFNFIMLILSLEKGIEK